MTSTTYLHVDGYVECKFILAHIYIVNVKEKKVKINTKSKVLKRMKGDKR